MNGYEMTLKIKELIKENNLPNVPIISYSSVDLDK